MAYLFLSFTDRLNNGSSFKSELYNQSLTEQETKNLDELLRLDSYDPNKNASNWINFINKMK